MQKHKCAQIYVGLCVYMALVQTLAARWSRTFLLGHFPREKGK